MSQNPNVGDAYISVHAVPDPKSGSKITAKGLGVTDLSTSLSKISFGKDFMGQLGRLEKVFGSFKGATLSVGGLASGGVEVAGLGAAATGIGVLGAGLVGAAAAIKATNQELDNSVNSWAKLEQKLNVISSINGGMQAFDQYKESILSVASTTSWTAEQVADGMEALVRGGLDVGDATKTISVVANLARGQVSDMASMGDLLSNVRNQFGLSVNDVNHIADVVSAATAGSAQGVNDFSQAMVYAGTVAGKSGQSLERTAAQLMALANVGIKGSQGGTAINALMNRVMGNSETIKALQEIRVAIYNQDGSLRNLDEIMRDAGQAMKDQGKSQQAQNAIWTKIAGAENLKSALALSETNLDTISETLKSIEGLTKQQADAVDRGIEGNRAIIESIRDSYSKTKGEAGADGYTKRLENLKTALEAQKPIIEKQAAALEKFANATSDWGTIQGASETIWLEIKTLITQLSANLASWLSPISKLLGRILSGIAGSRAGTNEYIKNSNDEAAKTYTEERETTLNNAAKRLVFESVEKSNNKKYQYKNLTGESAYQQASLDKAALESKTNRTAAEEQQLRAANVIVERFEKAFKGVLDMPNFKKQLNATELGELQQANKKRLDSAKEALVIAQKNVDDSNGWDNVVAKEEAVKLLAETQALVDKLESKQKQLDAAANLAKKKEEQPKKEAEPAKPIEPDDYEFRQKETEEASSRAQQEYDKQAERVDENRRQEDLKKDASEMTGEEVQRRLDDIEAQRADAEAKLAAAREQFEKAQAEGADTSGLETVIDALIKAIKQATASEDILKKELPRAQARDAQKEADKEAKDKKEDDLEEKAKAIGVEKKDLQDFINGQFKVAGNGILQQAGYGGFDASAVNALAYNSGVDEQQLQTLKKLLRNVEEINGKPTTQINAAVIN